MIQESACGYWQAIVGGRLIAECFSREAAEAALAAHLARWGDDND